MLITTAKATDVAFKEIGIIPEVVDEFNSTTVLGLNYGTKEVVLGNEFTINETQVAPEVLFVPESTSANYTIVMTDPDAPSRENPKFREWRHWVVSNITNGPEVELRVANIKNGTTLTEYMGPAPPAGTGNHRYVFLLYLQPEGVKINDNIGEDNRPGWKVRDWAKEKGLRLVAGNYFVCSRT